MALVPALLATGLQAPAPSVGHLRLCNRSLVEIAREATRRSSTFERLSMDIEAAPIIVYVRVARCPHDVRSCLHFLAASPRARTLRISLAWANAPPFETAGLLAHELEHAREVVTAPEVLDVPSFGRLFARLGWHGRGGYETCRGSSVARQVEREYIAGRVRPVL